MPLTTLYRNRGVRFGDPTVPTSISRRAAWFAARRTRVTVFLFDATCGQQLLDVDWPVSQINCTQGATGVDRLCLMWKVYRSWHTQGHGCSMQSASPNSRSQASTSVPRNPLNLQGRGVPGAPTYYTPQVASTHSPAAVPLSWSPSRRRWKP